jgi:hypothetical protein
MTAELGDRLAEAIEAAAAPVLPDEAVARGRRQRRRRRATVATVTVGAVGIAAVSFVATRPSDQPRLNVAGPTTSTQPNRVVAPRCTAADLRRPWPSIPQPERVVKRYVIDDLTHINPAGDVQPRVSAERAWLAAKDELTGPKSQFYPPAGGTASIVFGNVASSSSVPSTHLLAWVIILHDTAQNALRTRSERETPPPNPPCYFGHAYAVIDANTGRWVFGGGQGGVDGDNLPANPGSLNAFPSSDASAPDAKTTTTVETRDGSLDLHTVDWNNSSVPGRACFRSDDIRLHDGNVLLPDNVHGRPVRPGSDGVRYDQLGLGGRVAYGDFQGDGHDDAAVPLDCNNNGGTADGLLLNSVAVYSGRTGAPTYLGLITPRHQPEHVLPTLLSVASITSGTITVHEAWYGPNDMTCCPHGRATSTWSLSAGKVVPVATKITALPK